MRLAYAYIPISFYNINDTNNKLYFYELSEITILKVATIPNGNYDNTTILDAISTAMDTVSGGNTYSTTFNATTSKITISTGSNFRIYNSLDKTTYPNNAHKHLGFNSDSLTAFDTSQTAPNLINLNVVDTLNISVGNSLGVETLKNVGSSLLIPITENSLSYINYEPDRFQQYITFQKCRSVVEVKVKDQDSNLVDFNNIDWYLVLERNM
jgi:hypothetical protein